MRVGIGKVGSPGEMVLEIEAVIPELITDFNEVKGVVLESTGGKANAGEDKKQIRKDEFKEFFWGFWEMSHIDIIAEKTEVRRDLKWLWLRFWENGV